MPPPQGTPNPLEGPGDYTVTKRVHNNSYTFISPVTSPTHSGHKVFIVGASRGIGQAIALSFASSGASSIAIGARSSLSSVAASLVAAAKEAGHPAPKVLEVKLDVTSESSTNEAAKLVEKEFGGLDILINNAGILTAQSTIADSSPGEWWGCFEVNLKGVYLVTRAFIPLLLSTNGGNGMKTIVTTSSVGAHLVSKTLSAYQTSKLALLRFTEFVCEDYKEEGLLAFCIHPGNVITDIVGGEEGLPAFLRPIFVEKPELAADTITFLTKEKRDWLAGRYINVTWDMEELMAMEEEIVKGDKLKVKLNI